MRKLIILRGISGSGKSTYTAKLKKLAKTTVGVCSADFYFHRGREYKFNPRLLGKAHQFSKETCQRLMEQGVELIICDNTNTRWNFECMPYVKMAEKYNYEVEVTRFEVSTSTAAKRNIHNVPEGAIEKQASRIDSTPEKYKEYIIHTEEYNATT